jgi:ABC-type transport system substrate-binding protein
VTRLPFIALLVVLSAACSSPAPTNIPAASEPEVVLPPAPTPDPGPFTLHFGLVGEPAPVNAWSLFDESGASYANHAVRYGEYPTLYRLSIPGREFEAYIAEGLPSAVVQEGDHYTATVKLRTGLYWSDGSPLTAADVAFTANTALAFHLGLDWSSAYNPDLLDRAEAPNAATVKFFFRSPFNAGDWQYGALQGPLLNKAYWEPRLAGASALLPAQEVLKAWEQTRAQAIEMQKRIDADNAQLRAGVADSQQRNEIEIRIRRNQDELNSLSSKNVKLQDEVNAAWSAARTELYALSDDGEPTFGPYLRYTLSEEILVRSINPSYPFEKPAYDSLGYAIFKTDAEAVQAFDAGRVDVVLAPSGVSKDSGTRTFQTSSMAFLVFNPARPSLADPALRRALACMLAPQIPPEGILPGFVTAGPWIDGEALVPCSGLSNPARLEEALRLLREAGYAWAQAPRSDQPGVGMLLPGGFAIRPASLLTVGKEVDAERFSAAAHVSQQAALLGIPVEIRTVDPASLRYAVFSTQDYDMAIMSWRLAEYPGYLCEWFGPAGGFASPDPKLQSACSAFDSTADLGTAVQAAYDIQSALVDTLPFIPLYQGIQADAFQHVRYPFDMLVDGIAGIYGAPELAEPLP